MSPLVWDLGHIAAFEDLWVCRETGRDQLRRDLAAVYDADETPRAGRGELAYLRRNEAIAYMDEVRKLTGAGLRLDDFFTDGSALFGLAFARAAAPA
jgi:gamma-glutamyl hercynylcysteine S-oxide synthase